MSQSRTPSLVRESELINSEIAIVEVLNRPDVNSEICVCWATPNSRAAKGQDMLEPDLASLPRSLRTTPTNLRRLESSDLFYVLHYAADHRCIDEHGHGQPHAKLLDEHELQGHEHREDDDHDRGRAGDRPRRDRDPPGDRLA